MSCDTCESFANATSEVITEVVVRPLAVATAVAAVVLAFSPVAAESSGQAQSSAPELFSVATTQSVAVATDDATINATSTITLTSRANAIGTIVTQTGELLVSTASATSEVLLDDNTQLVSSAQATSVIVASSTTGTATLVSTATGRSTAILTDAPAVATSTAEASSDVLIDVRASIELTATAEATSLFVATEARAADALAISSAVAASSIVGVQVEHNVLVVSTFTATDGYWFVEPEQVAWVVNTETNAPSTYSSFPFTQLVQTRKNVVGVSPEGLFLMSGDTDAGAPIRATLDFGFSDMGTSQTKRVENLIVGYKSGNALRAIFETYGSRHGAYSYTMEPRDSAAPRNSRVRPGRGLSGRYWRVRIENIDGGDFTVHNMAVDVAVSTRRM